MTDVRIQPWRTGDLWLVRALTGDPAMMRHLGGPESEEKIADRQRRYEAPGSGMFRIVVAGEPAGSVGFWDKEWREQCVYEVGWSVLPAFQGRGVALAAAGQVLALAKADGARRFVHAFPSVENAASNAICRSLGFTLLGEEDFEYPPGSHLRCNDWRLDLRAAP